MLWAAELLAGLSPPLPLDFALHAPAQPLGTAKRSTQQSPTGKIPPRQKPQHCSAPSRTVPCHPEHPPLHPSSVQPPTAPSGTGSRQVRVPRQG